MPSTLGRPGTISPIQHCPISNLIGTFVFPLSLPVTHSVTQSVSQKPRGAVSPISVIVRSPAAFCLTCPSSVLCALSEKETAPATLHTCSPLLVCVRRVCKAESTRRKEGRRGPLLLPEIKQNSALPRQHVAHEAASYVLSNERNYRRLS